MDCGYDTAALRGGEIQKGPERLGCLGTGKVGRIQFMTLEYKAPRVFLWLYLQSQATHARVDTPRGI